MRALAVYIMKGPLQAMLVTAAFALISLIPILGMVSVVSGAAVALVTLRQGAKEGVKVLVGASLISGLFLYFLMGTIAVSVAFALLLWMPLLGLALILRRTASWSMALDAAAALGVLGVVAIYVLLGSPAQLWQQLLTAMLDAMAIQRGGAELEIFREQIPAIAEWMTGMLAGAIVLGLIAGMMLARWWQATLYNPGGFRQEFYGLRQSKVAGITMFVILGISLFDMGFISRMAGDIMVIAVVVYSVVGLSLVHALVAGTGKHVAWLVALYVAILFVPPHIMVALAGLGFADSWMDFRTRLLKKDSQGPAGPQESDRREDD